MGDAAERWVVAAEPGKAANLLAAELSLPPAIAQLLVCRGFSTVAEARAFLEPTIDQLHDPNLMLGMAVAVARLRAALLAHEPVLIYGDYDVDGTVATVLLKTAADRAAALLGVKADIRYHIPHRIREGYGIQDARIEAAAAEGVRLVVSVDTGIRAFAAAAEARRVGLDLIVTDHHLPDERGVPEAVAVLNPNQPGCGYPYKEICGAGVAFKLAQALLESAAITAAERTAVRDKTLPSFLKLLAIATIADAVPLTGENRVIAALGLTELRKPSQAGLRALMALAGIDGTRAISASDVGFRLAPRINAAGRMDVAGDVVEMFLSRDPAIAQGLAEKLHRLNDDRRATEAEALRGIEAQIETQTSALTAAGLPLPGCFVLDDAAQVNHWHRGVIGILASRVVDQTARPALVITHEDGVAYGSGRSVKGFHLLDALTSVHHAGNDALLTRFGGHAHAVGFSLPSDRVTALRTALEQYAREHQGAPSTPELACDVAVALSELNPLFLETLERLGPFGMGNPEPVFISRNVRLATALKVIQERHLKVCLEGDGARFSGMAWGRKTDWPAHARTHGWAEGTAMDVAFRMRRNWHPDFGGWELEIIGLRNAALAA